MLSDELFCPELTALIHARLMGKSCSSGRKTSEIRFLFGDDPIEHQLDNLAAIYVALGDTLGMAIWPDMLPNLGWPGRLLHQVFCTRPGTWRAFRSYVARAHRRYPHPTPLTRDRTRLASQQEMFVYKTVQRLPGITKVDVHPYLPDGRLASKADFRLTGATRRTVYVEVAMVASDAGADTIVCAGYRDRLLRKLDAYRRLGLCPVLIWADQAASPRALAARLNDALAVLGLPTRPPAPPAWYELQCGMPLWAGYAMHRTGRGSFGGLVQC